MKTKIITREKHLDHMVKVVPLITFAYAIQCYFIFQMEPVEYATNGLLFLGACLGMMISAFITYDMTHVVKLDETSAIIEMKWLGYQREVKFSDLKEVSVSEPGESFATLKLVTKSGRSYKFYFVDEAEKVKTWIEEKRFSETKIAA